MSCLEETFGVGIPERMLEVATNTLRSPDHHDCVYAFMLSGNVPAFESEISSDIVAKGSWDVTRRILCGFFFAGNHSASRSLWVFARNQS